MNRPPPPVPPAEFDAAALGRLRELDPDGRNGVLPRVLAAFESSLARLLGQLVAERDAGQAAAAGAIAHTLRSSATSVGALRLASACEQVERAARQGGGTAQRHDVDHLIAEGQAALAAVQAMLRSDPAPR
jgi:HPt (histidine-containing phosphotransfer) domain-containing protein